MEKEDWARNGSRNRKASYPFPYPFIPLPIPVFMPISSKNFDEIIDRVWPPEYYDSLIHLRNARIELLKAVNSAVSKRIETLEKEQREARPQKEKVKVS